MATHLGDRPIGIAATAKVQRRVPLVLLAGLVGGVVWGANARLWMRFITTDPEFTSSGSLFIVVGFGAAAVGQSAVYLGRRRHLHRPALTALRVIGVVALVPLSFGAGALAFPAIIFAPLALTQRNWSLWIRGATGVIALLPVLAVAVSLFADLSAGRAAIGIIWFLALYALIIWAARFSLAPQLDGWSAPLPLRLLGTVALSPVLLLTVVVLTSDL